MSQQVKTWIKHISGMEDVDLADVEKLLVRKESTDSITFEFWDYEGKRSETVMPQKMAIVLSRSILLCIEGSLSEIGVNI